MVLWPQISEHLSELRFHGRGLIVSFSLSPSFILILHITVELQCTALSCLNFLTCSAFQLIPLSFLCRETKRFPHFFPRIFGNLPLCVRPTNLLGPQCVASALGLGYYPWWLNLGKLNLKLPICLKFSLNPTRYSDESQLHHGLWSLIIRSLLIKG